MALLSTLAGLEDQSHPTIIAQINEDLNQSLKPVPPPPSGVAESADTGSESDQASEPGAGLH